MQFLLENIPEFREIVKTHNKTIEKFLYFRSKEKSRRREEKLKYFNKSRQLRINY